MAENVPMLLPGASPPALWTRMFEATTDPEPPSVPPATVIRPSPVCAPLIRSVPLETIVGPV